MMKFKHSVLELQLFVIMNLLQCLHVIHKVYSLLLNLSNHFRDFTSVAVVSAQFLQTEISEKQTNKTYRETFVVQEK